MKVLNSLFVQILVVNPISHGVLDQGLALGLGGGHCASLIFQPVGRTFSGQITDMSSRAINLHAERCRSIFASYSSPRSPSKIFPKSCKTSMFTSLRKKNGHRLKQISQQIAQKIARDLIPFQLSEICT